MAFDKNGNQIKLFDPYRDKSQPVFGTGGIGPSDPNFAGYGLDPGLSVLPGQPGNTVANAVPDFPVGSNEAYQQSLGNMYGTPNNNPIQNTPTPSMTSPVAGTTSVMGTPTMPAPVAPISGNMNPMSLTAPSSQANPNPIAATSQTLNNIQPGLPATNLLASRKKLSSFGMIS